jgi:hypothetical protein
VFRLVDAGFGAAFTSGGATATCSITLVVAFKVGLAVECCKIALISFSCVCVPHTSEVLTDLKLLACIPMSTCILMITSMMMSMLHVPGRLCYGRASAALETPQTTLLRKLWEVC